MTHKGTDVAEQNCKV